MFNPKIANVFAGVYIKIFLLSKIILLFLQQQHEQYMIIEIIANVYLICLRVCYFKKTTDC